MVTAANMVTFQKQLRSDMAGMVHQLRTEMNETVNGRIDMLSSVNTALQSASVNPVACKPYRIGDLILGNWEGSNDKV